MIASGVTSCYTNYNSSVENQQQYGFEVYQFCFDKNKTGIYCDEKKKDVFILSFLFLPVYFDVLNFSINRY